MLRTPEGRANALIIGVATAYIGALACISNGQPENLASRPVVAETPASDRVLAASELPPKQLISAKSLAPRPPRRVVYLAASRSRSEVIPKIHHSGAHSFLAPTAVQLEVLRDCESGSDYHYNDGQFYGAYNFDLQTWHGMGYNGRPDQASTAVQDAATREIVEARGFEPFPGCERKHPDELTARAT